jgi:hypothetical protein
MVTERSTWMLMVVLSKLPVLRAVSWRSTCEVPVKLEEESVTRQPMGTTTELMALTPTEASWLAVYRPSGRYGYVPVNVSEEATAKSRSATLS